jgi:hypothetical protein
VLASALVPKRFQSLSNHELRELHLALALRIKRLRAMNTGKMGPNGKAELKEQLDVCNDLNDAVQKARGK